MQRQISLDIFRGLTLAAMLLVNNPGSWSHVYAPLLHASWHGFTPTDLIFPFFMFIVGAAMFYSMASFAHKGFAHSRDIPWFKIAKRTALLFLIGFLLHIIPFNHSPDTWRIMGVLQRIALCYGLAAILICWLSVRQLWLLNVLILLSYWGLLNVVPEPYALDSNLVRSVDLFLFGAGHLYQGFGVAFDPEGLLSCWPAVSTVLLGYLTSAKLNHLAKPQSQARSLFIWGLVALAVAWLWHGYFPVNKPLWTSSYVVLTAGFAWLLLAGIIGLYEVVGLRRGFVWAQIYGSNPLFIYVLAALLSITLRSVAWVDSQGQSTNLQRFIYQNLQEILSDKNASLVFALLFVGVFYLLANWLYQRRIFIKL
jgi:predicted acyltransferase